MTARVEQIGDATLYLGDCREILPTLGKVDALVTDPPYGVNLGNHLAAKDGRLDHKLVKMGYINYDDTEDNLIAIIVPAVAAALALSRRGLVFCAGSNVWHFPRADIIGGVFIPSAMGRNKWGFTSFWPCLLYGRAPALHLGARATALTSTEAAEPSEHPCPKPLGWMTWAVNLTSLVGHTILDPFMGSGTTGVACANLGRKFIGIEIEPRYFDIACRRIDEAYRQPRLFPEAVSKPEQRELLT